MAPNPRGLLQAPASLQEQEPSLDLLVLGRQDLMGPLKNPAVGGIKAGQQRFEGGTGL